MVRNSCRGKAKETRQYAPPELDPATCEVYLIGPVKLQNSLLNFMIRDELALQSFCIDELDPSRFKSKRRILVLVDGNGRSVWELIPDPMPIERLPGHCLVAFFNIRENGIKELRREIAAMGIAGIFFENVPLESLLSGIREIFMTDPWHARRRSAEDQDASTLLNLWEKKMLSMVASGATDEDIGKTFSIGDEAVKSSLARIYLKIGVPDRLQASFWAVENI